LPDHPAPPAGEAPIPSPQPPDRRLRAIDDAWEAIVREELARIRRTHQRNSRFSRPEEGA
jgi:hypothetical protein